jgi:GGDEF domain-containing protein
MTSLPTHHLELQTDLRIVFFELTGGFGEKIEHSPITVVTRHSYLEFAQKGPHPYCIIIGSNDVHKAHRLVKSLRADGKASLTPIFSFKSLGEPTDRLLDGIVETVADASERAAGIIKALDELDEQSLNGSDSDTYRLLAMLYSRPDGLLEPYRHWQDRAYYGYPMVDAMFGKSAGAALLESLNEHRLIEPARLVDRLRHCPKCDGVHLNYVDVCPNCGDLDIVNQPFLHCFACGHVAPEVAFFSQEALICPNCKGRLRHIGSDYDRPLENYHCHGCGHVFIEPAISCRCMHCGAANNTEALIPRQIHAYHLTRKGRISATTGSIEDIFSLFDSMNNVNSMVFESILEWLLSLCRRHDEEQFSLIVIRLVNIMELTDQLGRYKIKEIVDEFARRVRELIRTTDLTTRTNQYTLWLLLPKTHPQGNQIVLDRILGIKTQGDVHLQLATTSYHAPSQTLKAETAKLLMARLQSEVLE